MLSFDKDHSSKSLSEFSETKAGTDVLEKLLKKGMISPTKIQPDDYFFNLLTLEKKDGSYRTILNLKYQNEECYIQHFKIEYLRHAIYMIKPSMYLAPLDIKDAFNSIPAHKTYQKFRNLLLKEKALQFNAIPNGYKDAMRNWMIKVFAGVYH